MATPKKMAAPPHFQLCSVVTSVWTLQSTIQYSLTAITDYSQEGDLRVIKSESKFLRDTVCRDVEGVANTVQGVITDAEVKQEMKEMECKMKEMEEMDISFNETLNAICLNSIQVASGQSVGFLQVSAEGTRAHQDGDGSKTMD